MIPKIIHYCWFGKGELPQLAIKCINTWKKYFPDYEIIEWNEDNFDVNINIYTKQAYENKKYAFVSDYARLWALYNYGGIYFDTDVKVLKPLDDFLHHPAFGGFENDDKLATSTLASEKGGLWILENMNIYNNLKFINGDGSFDLTPNVRRFTNHLLTYGLILNNTYQEFPNLVTIYPKDYFSPKDYESSRVKLTENSHTIHLFDASWVTRSLLSRMKGGLKYVLGMQVYSMMSKVLLFWKK